MKMIEIEKLLPEKIEEAIGVMLTAFEDEALTSSWLDLTDQKLKSIYADLVKIIYTIHIDSGDPVYIAVENGNIIGLAALSTPDAKKNKLKAAVLIIKKLPRLLRLVPIVFKAVRALFKVIKPPKNLPDSYCTLEVFAVAPEHQGRGIGRLLLDQVHINYSGKSDISGIYLVTGDDKNVNMYKRFGYEVVEKRQAEKVQATAYHMFKANNQF